MIPLWTTSDVIFANRLAGGRCTVRNAVRCPTRMRDSEIAVDGFRRECPPRVERFFPLPFESRRLAVHDCDASRIVPAVSRVASVLQSKEGSRFAARYIRQFHT